MGAVLLATLLLAGCGQAARPPGSAVPPNPTASPTPTALGELTQDVLAVFETSENDANLYEVFVQVVRDIPTTRTGVVAQGEFEVDGEQLYYEVLDFDQGSPPNPKVRFSLDSDLRAATVSATVVVERCTDEENQPVTDGRCPVRKRVSVNAVVICNGPLEPQGPSDAPVGRGRKCTASGTIGEHTYEKSAYAVVTENLTRQ
jgi:hypothetical protein